MIKALSPRTGFLFYCGGRYLLHAAEWGLFSEMNAEYVSQFKV